MSSVVVIGDGEHKRATCIKWNAPFPNIEEYDSMIIDLTTFPALPARGIGKTVFDNLMELDKAQTIFMSKSRETFCIIGEPIGLDTEEPRLKKVNYIWFPNSEKLHIERKKTGKSKIVEDQRFAKYFDFVEEWCYEISVGLVQYYSFSSICINKSGKYIAGTLSYGLGQGKIHLLPKTTKIDVSDSIELLIDLALGKEISEFPWREQIEIPALQEIEHEIDALKAKMVIIRKSWADLNLKWKEQESYRDIFSKDDNKVPKAVQRILADLGIETKETPSGYVIDLISDKVGVEVTSIKGKVDAKTSKVTQLSRFIEEDRRGQKVIFVANSYKEIPITERYDKEHVTEPMEKFLKSVEVSFVTALTLYQLWLKVQKREMRADKAAALILENSGVLKI